MPSKAVVNFIVAVVAVAYLVSYLIQGAPVTTDLARPLGAAAAVAALLLQAYDRFLWRLPLIRVVAHRPDIDGTWKGTLSSHYVDPDTGQRIPPDPEVFMVIRQRYWSAAATLITKESRSYSLIAEIDPDGGGQYRLLAIYRNTSRASVRHRSPIHHGTLMLDISGEPPNLLEGFYWTDRDTMGELLFTQRAGAYVNDHSAARNLFV